MNHIQTYKSFNEAKHTHGFTIEDWFKKKVMAFINWASKKYADYKNIKMYKQKGIDKSSTMAQLEVYKKDMIRNAKILITNIMAQLDDSVDVDITKDYIKITTSPNYGPQGPRGDRDFSQIVEINVDKSFLRFYNADTNEDFKIRVSIKEIIHFYYDVLSDYKEKLGMGFILDTPLERELKSKKDLVTEK